MSTKVVQKSPRQFSLEYERFFPLLKNCPKIYTAVFSRIWKILSLFKNTQKCLQIGQKSCCHRLKTRPNSDKWDNLVTLAVGNERVEIDCATDHQSFFLWHLVNEKIVGIQFLHLRGKGRPRVRGNVLAILRKDKICVSKSSLLCSHKFLLKNGQPWANNTIKIFSVNFTLHYF